MDDIIDLELEKIIKIQQKIDSDPEMEDVKHTERTLWEKIYKKSVHGRLTGVGITAEGDILAALGLRYGTEEATDFSEKVHRTVAIAAYRSSVNMAKERGAFEIYDSEREKGNPMIERIKEADPELYKKMAKHGRRNISMLTIAPTGTTSLMSQTTSGIEPVFLPYYKRRRKVNPNDKNVVIAYRDEVGDYFEEYYVFHHKFLKWCEIHGYPEAMVRGMSDDEIKALVMSSPYYKATSNDIDWVAKVKMQGKIQKWVDHSISVTVNLPNSVTEELVAEVYKTAWESGCKGMTVYRDGSRTGVLVSAKETKKEVLRPKKRPKALAADIIRFRNGNENWIAFIGMMNGAPYEIFTGLAEEDTINIPRSIDKGFIVKEKTEDGRSIYNFQYVNKNGYTQTVGGISHMFNKEFWNYARLISGVLRNGMPIVDVLNLIAGLSLDSETINTWKNGVERALKKYIPDGTKDETGKKCSKCHSDNLVYQEGCLTCMNCGYSKCS